MTKFSFSDVRSSVDVLAERWAKNEGGTTWVVTDRWGKTLVVFSITADAEQADVVSAYYELT